MKQTQVIVAKLADYPLSALQQHPRLSPALQHYAASLKPANQQRFLCGRALLSELLAAYQPINVLPEITTNNNGRPQFSAANLPDFNISHSGKFIAVALAPAGKVGIDIEQQRAHPRFMKVAQHIFSQTEIQWLRQQSDPLAAFWQLWTMREAALKLAAKGVWQMRLLQVNPQHLQIEAPFLPACSVRYQATDDYHLSICTTVA